MESDSGWPGFRGPRRDGIARGVRIETDWSHKPPVAVWRQPIGPGWSSFAVRGNLFYTQEQRGGDELVSCYNLTTGKPVWRHSDAARFYESNAGAGPRGTPNTRTKVPGWGFASSPLVVGDVVIVAAAGALAAYDVGTGKPRWFGPTGGRGYSSPQLATIDGVAQVLLLNGEGVISVAPADGTLLWKHAWEGDSIVQPAVTADGDVLIGSGSGLGSEVGVRRVAVNHGSDGWTALVEATPDQFTELARFPAIEGKTWNHPVLVGDILLVRNGEEMVAFRMSLASG